SYINIARTYDRQGDTVRALESYKKAVEAADDMAFTHAELGRYYMKLQRSAEALDQLKQAEKLNPNEPGIAEDMARLQAR
ncbi:MAG: tetratricopeptide repeat protein, partial [Phycisphaerae bacterium]|nr:tetratricopeptide repeat protein [Phycisphaerae bacterium]